MKSINKDLVLKDGDVLRISANNSNFKMIIKCIGETLHFDNETIHKLEEKLPIKKVIDKNTIEYQTNEGLYVYYHTIEALYQKYYGCIPKNIENKIEHLMIELMDMTEYSDERVVKEEEFFKRVVYEDYKYLNKFLK